MRVHAQVHHGAQTHVAADDFVRNGTVAAGRRQLAPIVALLPPSAAVVAVLSPFCRRFVAAVAAAVYFF